MKKFGFYTVLSIFLAITGLSLLVINYSYFFPSAYLSFPLNRNQLEQKAILTLEDWGYNPQGFNIHTELRVRKGLLSYIHERYQDSDSLEYYISQKIPAFYWAVTWERTKDKAGQHPDSMDSVIPSIKRAGINLTQAGEELGFWIEVYEDSTMPSLDMESARAMADSIVKIKADYPGITFDNIKQQAYENRVDYYVVYSAPEMAGIPVHLQIGLIGNRVGKYEYVFENISETESDFNQLIFFLFLVLVLMALFIYTLVKKLRADELYFKSAIPFGILVVIFTLIDFFLENITLSTSNVFTGMILAPLFMGLFSTIVIACADSVTRDAWNDKLFSFDLMTRGKLYNPFIGHSVLKGIAYGFIFVGIVSLLYRGVMMITFIDFVPFSSDVRDINSQLPFVFRLSSILSNSLWTQFIFVLFLSSFFARYFSHRRWIILTVALFWAARAIPGETIDSPQWFLAIYFFISGIYFVSLFIKYDFLTSLTAYFIFLLSIEAVRMFNFNHIAFIAGGSAFVILFLIILIGSIVGSRHNIHKDELLKYTPKHVKKLLDRERMKRELEIAKRVQLNFLPHSHPSINKLEIASICLPAEEVGGDYYDFIQFNENKLGVVIGDVSGKGISAAFYMTLTKGFLRSLVRLNQSTRQVLTEINSLFYENVERTHFISMVYGIFDMDNMNFTFSRAGHNPVIHRKADGTITTVCPPGLALGLDPGTVFETVIKESQIPLEKDDVFVLYTDGFSEAMDKHQHEFSEQMLEELVQKYGDLPAHDLLAHIKKEIKSFTESSNQHDDMTMLVMKVT